MKKRSVIAILSLSFFSASFAMDRPLTLAQAVEQGDKTRLSEILSEETLTQEQADAALLAVSKCGYEETAVSMLKKLCKSQPFISVLSKKALHDSFCAAIDAKHPKKLPLLENICRFYATLDCLKNLIDRAITNNTPVCIIEIIGCLALHCDALFYAKGGGERNKIRASLSLYAIKQSVNRGNSVCLTVLLADTRVADCLAIPYIDASEIHSIVHDAALSGNVEQVRALLANSAITDCLSVHEIYTIFYELNEVAIMNAAREAIQEILVTAADNKGFFANYITPLFS